MTRSLLFFLLLGLFPILLSAQHMVQVEKNQSIEEGSSVNDILVDQGNKVWIATEKGLYTYSYSGGRRDIETSEILALAMNDEGEVWSANADGAIFQGGDRKQMILESESPITSMTFQGNLLWVATQGDGIYVFNTTVNKLTGHFHKDNSKLQSNDINFIINNKVGTIWAGTEKGVLEIKGDKWKVYEKNNPITAAALYEDDVWFVGNETLWLVDSDNRWERILLDARLTDGKVRDMAFDDEGRLYFASEVFSRYDIIEDTMSVYGKPIGFVSDQSRCVTADLDGNMWVGTKKRGLFRFRLYFEETEDIPLSAICYMESEPKCPGESGGVLKVNVSGGKEPYSIKWDCRGCRGDSASGLSAGDYPVTVTDATGKSLELLGTVLEPRELEVIVKENKNISRAGGKDGVLEVQGAGGTGAFTYLWEDGSKEPRRERLLEGEYALTMTDGNGCSVEEAFTVEGVKILPELVSGDIKEGMTIRLEQLYFQADSLGYEDSSIPTLNEVYVFLNKNPKIAIEIGGHTNGLPSHEYCDWLSQGRAQRVAEYFYAKGISTKQVVYKGYGKREPVDTNKTKAGRKRNQRVEIKFIEYGD